MKWALVQQLEHLDSRGCLCHQLDQWVHVRRGLFVVEQYPSKAAVAG
jgi:hypothetical protein